MRYINFDNLTNKSFSFRIILTKVTFVMASVAYVMLDPTCFILGMPLGTFILTHVLVKCHFGAFVALSRSSGMFCRNQTLRFVKPDSPFCQTRQSGFYRLTSTLLFLDSQLHCSIFLYNRSTFFEISFFVF
jgi:hypothetical protein